MGEVWSYICHKDGHWAGLVSPEVGKKELARFLGQFAAEGFSISSVASRDEFDAKMATLKPWSKHPSQVRP